MTNENSEITAAERAKDYEYDLVVSFAGEDRELVAELVEKCNARGYSVFYDEDAVGRLWGEELPEYFADVYEKRSRAALMFISEHYARKSWTTHERKSILSRALEQAPTKDGPYMFPIRIDDTSLPGLRTTIHYVDARRYSTDQIVSFIEEKIGNPMNPPRKIIERTPLTDEECGDLLSQRPPAWEFFYTAFLMIKEVEVRKSRLRDVRNGFYNPGDYIDAHDLFSYASEEVNRVMAIVEAFNDLLAGNAQKEAWGDLGEPGDADAIEYLADRYGKLIDMLLDWTEKVGGRVSDSEEARAYLRALSRYAAQPIEALVTFPKEFRKDVDKIPVALAKEENIELTLTIAWEIPQDIQDAFLSAQEALAATLK